MRKTTVTICVLFAAAAATVCLCGCKSPEYYKQDADERAYKVIDEKWDPNVHGPMVNYRIEDVPAASGSLQVPLILPASGKLNLPQAISYATAHNRFYQTQKDLLYTTALDLRLFEHAFENQYFGFASAEYAHDSPDETVTSAGTFGFNRLLAGGARITTAVTVAWVEVLTGNIDEGLQSLFSTTVTQPLLRGSGREIVQEPLTQAQRDVLYAIRTFSRFRKEFVVDVITQYYQTLELLDFLHNAEANYATLLMVQEKAQQLADAGRLPQYELEQANQDVLEARDTVLQAQRDYKQALDEFKVTLAINPRRDVELDMDELGALAAADLPEPAFTETDVLTTALVLRLDLANAGDRIYDAERKVLVAEDALRAGLDLTATAAATHEPGTNLTTLRTIRGEASLGVDLDLPLDRVDEQNVYRKALLTVDQRQRDYEEAMDTVSLQVRSAYRDFREAAARYRVQQQSLVLAKKRFENTMLLLQYGRADTRDVLDAQEDLFDAQANATEALVDFNIATLNFYRDTGVLQVRPDGMWKL